MKPAIALAVVVTLLEAASFAAAQEKPRVFDVWPGKAPGENGKLGDEKFLEQKPGEKPVKRLTNVTRPTLTVFRPSKEKRYRGRGRDLPRRRLPASLPGTWKARRSRSG